MITYDATISLISMNYLRCMKAVFSMITTDESLTNGKYTVYDLVQTTVMNHKILRLLYISQRLHDHTLLDPSPGETHY